MSTSRESSACTQTSTVCYAILSIPQHPGLHQSTATGTLTLTLDFTTRPSTFPTNPDFGPYRGFLLDTLPLYLQSCGESKVDFPLVIEKEIPRHRVTRWSAHSEISWIECGKHEILNTEIRPLKSYSRVMRCIGGRFRPSLHFGASRGRLRSEWWRSRRTELSSLEGMSWEQDYRTTFDEWRKEKNCFRA